MANETIIRRGLIVKEGSVTFPSTIADGYVTITGGVISSTATAGSSYTDKNAQDAFNSSLALGTLTGLTKSYNSSTGAMSLTVTSSYVSSIADTQINAQKNVANGIPGLDSSGKISAAQLPAYVDDVLEYANTASFPATGSTGIIYVAIDSNKTYRWTGSVYVEISASNTPTLTQVLAAGNTVQTGTINVATIGLYDTANPGYATISTNDWAWTFTNIGGTGFTFLGDFLSTARNYELPNADGTLALQEWVTAQGYLTSASAASTYQPLDGDLTSIAGLAGTTGFLKKTAANTWTLDTSTYLTGNQTITLTGDVTGSGSTAITTSISAATVTGKALTGYVVGTNATLAATDTILGAFGKVQAQINAKQNTITTGTTSQYFKGDLSLGTLDTSAVPENGSLYYTNARAIAATLTGFTAGAGTITSSDSVLGAIQKLAGNANALPKQATGSVALGTGATAFFSFAKATYKTAFVKYVVYNGTNQKAGTIQVNNDGTSITYADTETTSIGNADAIIADAVVNGSNIDIRLTSVPDATYTVKYNVDYV